MTQRFCENIFTSSTKLLLLSVHINIHLWYHVFQVIAISWEKVIVSIEIGENHINRIKWGHSKEIKVCSRMKTGQREGYGIEGQPVLVDYESSKLSRWHSSTSFNEPHCLRVEYASLLHLATVFHLFFNSIKPIFQLPTYVSFKGQFWIWETSPICRFLQRMKVFQSFWKSVNFCRWSICDERAQLGGSAVIDQNWDGWKTDGDFVEDWLR